MVFFRVEVGKAVEPDHPVGDTTFPEPVGDRLCDADNDHGGEDVGQCAGELEHYDDDRDGDVHYAAEGGGGAEEGVGSGGDALLQIRI